MPHKTTIVEQVQLAPHLFAVRIQCCGKHDHWHTMHAGVVLDSDKMQASLETARELAALNHEAGQKAAAKLEALVGTEVEHEL